MENLTKARKNAKSQVKRKKQRDFIRVLLNELSNERWTKVK